MTHIVVKGGTVVDGRIKAEADVVIDSETRRIVEVGPDLSGDQIIDAVGCYVCPGFVDLHSHLRQPGGEAAETIETGARSAALGGYTAVVAMPNTNPCMDSAAVINEVYALGKDAACEVIPSGAITVGRGGEELAPVGELYDLGVRVFTDDGTGVQDPALMRTALEYAKGISDAGDQDIVFAQHCEVSALSAGGVMNESEVSSKLGLAGQPSEAEELMVARDIALSRLTQMPVHMQHVSTKRSVELIREAKEAGINVTAEATPHHFTLTDEKCESFDPVFKVHPPLRGSADVAAVKVGLADGTIDCIATDHAPHTADSKAMPFDQAPPGMIGLETAFALANTELDLDIEQIVQLMSVRPAEIAGITDRHGCSIEVDSVANLSVVDPKVEWTVDAAASASKSSNSPFHGMKLRGKVKHTICNGEVVVKDCEAQR